MIGDLFFDLYL